MRRVAGYYKDMHSYSWIIYKIGDLNDVEQGLLELWISQHRYAYLPPIQAIKAVEEACYKGDWIAMNVLFFKERK